MKAIFKTAFDAGYDAGLNGANDNNCHFSWFKTEKSTKDWQKGNDYGRIDRKNKDYEKKNKKLNRPKVKFKS